MIALLTQYGSLGEVEYVGVVVQTKPIKQGGRIVIGKFFECANYPDPEAACDGVMEWVKNQKVKILYQTDGLIACELCDCGCGERSHRRYEGA